MSSKLNIAMNKLAKDIESLAKEEVPVDTGKLKKSIKVTPVIKSNDDFGVQVSELAYGKYVDNQKYLTDAIKKGLDKNTKNITNAITDDILKNILSNGNN